MDNISTDLVIAGGGLAGMSLALQLRKTMPTLNIVIIEKKTFPIPNTIAKVGESTVEIGSHYFTDVLGLQEHFKQYHLKKHGLRLFFGNAESDQSEYDELGVSELFGIPTYQIERGVLENHLYSLLSAQGVSILDGAEPISIELGNKKHSITCKKGRLEYSYTSRWFVDAAGRQALLKNKLGLSKHNEHKGNALFFRVDKKVVIDDWSNDDQWQDRINDKGTRWLSTNHLMGPGYWIWIIPLGSGATSFGVVMDDEALAKSNIQSYEDTLSWLQQEHPMCAQALADARLLDFVILNDYSYDCKQFFSDKGWAITGEAGAFPDPFYSPGSDFIALNNTFVAKLIELDMKGNCIGVETILFQKFYRSFYDNTMSLYQNQYGGFGDRRMMSIKLVWDYAYYWGVLTLLFFTDSITNIQVMRTLNSDLMRAQKLNMRMQQCMNKRAQQRIVLPAKGLFMNQYLIPCLKHFNEVLKQDNLDVADTLRANISMMEKIVPCFEDMLTELPSNNINSSEHALLGNYRDSVLA